MTLGYLPLHLRATKYAWGVDLKSVSPSDTIPSVYTPFDSGEYRVAPGLSPLDASFGNGSADGQVFQLDSDFEQFRANGERARVRGVARYHATSGFSPAVEAAVVAFIARQLSEEHPEYFFFKDEEGRATLRCMLTGETLCFGDDCRLDPDSDGDYVSALDALAAQVQEDLAVVHVDTAGDRLVAVHAVAPSGWDPREKVGKDFTDIHAPVAEIEALSRRGSQLMKAVAQGGRFQRFVWGVTTDRELDHHPESPGAAPFDPANPRLFVRIERQVMVGLGPVFAFLFCIHAYFADCATMPRELRMQLRSGLLSMSRESRRYKGIADSFDDIVVWLERK